MKRYGPYVLTLYPSIRIFATLFRSTVSMSTKQLHTIMKLSSKSQHCGETLASQKSRLLWKLHGSLTGSVLIV